MSSFIDGMLVIMLDYLLLVLYRRVIVSVQIRFAFIAYCYHKMLRFVAPALSLNRLLCTRSRRRRASIEPCPASLHNSIASLDGDDVNWVSRTRRYRDSLSSTDIFDHTYSRMGMMSMA